MFENSKPACFFEKGACGHYIIIMNKNEIKKILLNYYLAMLLPAVLLILILYLLKYLSVNFNYIYASKLTSILILTLSALFSLGLPIFYRSLFVNKVKNLKSVSSPDFIAYEKATIMIALVTPYLLVISLIFNLREIYISFITLFSLYSVYYYYPSDKKIKFETKLFRVKDDE